MSDGIKSPRAPRRRQSEVDAARHDLNVLREDFRRVRDERDRMRRLFNRLETAISHHKKSDHWKEDVDVALYKARDKILTDYAEGKG